MIEEIEELRLIYLQTGQCKHPEKYVKTYPVFGIDITICGICNQRKELRN